MRGSSSTNLLALAAVALLGIAGCSPQIGDSCSLSTDCSIMGDRLCDTSMPGGYCTIFDCDIGGCPGDAVCAEFHPNADRFSRRFCIMTCSKPSDCRSSYQCVAPSDRDAVILDPNPPNNGLCLP